MATPCDPPEISLIVNTFMKPRHLGLVLDSIDQQTGVDGCFEVVISDDGSTDETPALVAARAATAPYRIAFTSRPHDGFRLARVRNDGVRQARGKRLLFLDGDCMLPQDHVAIHLSRCCEGVTTGGDCGRLSESQSREVDPSRLDADTVHRLLPVAERAALRRKLRKWRWYTLLRHRTKPRLVGNNICIHRHDFTRINGFDERFVGWGQEDDDITLRLRAAGVRLQTVLDRTCSLHVWHPTDPTATARWRDGPNVHYFLRTGRLTACRQGLRSRGLGELHWRLPPDLRETALGQAVAAILQVPDATSGAAESAEIDMILRPGRGTFAKRQRVTAGGGAKNGPDCRVILCPQGTRIPGRLRRQADRVLEMPVQPAATESWHADIASRLETLG